MKQFRKRCFSEFLVIVSLHVENISVHVAVPLPGVCLCLVAVLAQLSRNVLLYIILCVSLPRYLHVFSGCLCLSSWLFRLLFLSIYLALSIHVTSSVFMYLYLYL